MQQHAKSTRRRTSCVALLLVAAAAASVRAAPQANESGSLSLSAILEHQDALAAECAAWEQRERDEISQVLEYARQDPQRLYLGERPLNVRLPAVCLFLFSAQGGARNEQRPLELVNWFYDADDFAAISSTTAMTNSSNRLKRDVGMHSNNGEANHNKALEDYLFDMNMASNDPINSIDDKLAIKFGKEEIAKYRANIDKLLADPRYLQMIEANRERIGAYLSPIILMPGLLGSQLEARTHKTHRVNVFCAKNADWQDMWLSLVRLLPLVVDCWLDNVRLEIDTKPGGWAHEPAGVESRVPGEFGSLDPVRHLDERQPGVTSYMAPLIKRYELLGYTADVNLLAAPYDFRLAPQQLSAYWTQLKQLIERAHTNAGPRASSILGVVGGAGGKVTLVCHSMGCTHALIFLRHQSADWRQAYVRKLVAISSPWAGATKALKALVVGDQLDLPLVSEIKMRRLARTYPSIAYLLPQPEVFAHTSDADASGGRAPALVETPARAYDASQLAELLRELNLTKQLEWYEATASLIKPLKPLPDLHVDCLHSVNVPTPETLIFDKQSEFPDGKYTLVKGPGDGTVNMVSLLVCERWASQLPNKVRHKVIANTNHVGVLSHKATLAHITDDVLINWPE